MSITENSRRGLGNDQRGVISIVIAMVFIIVILLIVTGFAQIANRNSRIALDSQLSSQALYAAESGVNDAVQKLQAGGTVIDQTTCLGSGPNSYTVNGGVIGNAADGVSYTCQLVALGPDTLTYDSVTDASVVVPVEVAVGTIDKVAISWQRAPGAAAGANQVTCPPGLFGQSGGKWPATLPANCPYGLLRLDILPATAAALTTADAAAQNTATAFINPSSSNAAASFAYAANPSANRYSAAANQAVQGRVLRAGCNATTCSVTVNGLSFPKAYFRITMLYQSSQNVQIASTGINVGRPFENAQAIVDVTGKAQDVVRRIQVRVPMNGVRGDAVNGLPEYAIQSEDSICKRYYAAPLLPPTLIQDIDGCNP